MNIFSRYLAVALMSVFVLVPCAYAQDAAPAKAGVKVSAAELKRMSIFLSNFTELGMMNFTTEELKAETWPAQLVTFGIRHNYRNNYASRVVPCKGKDCKPYELAIEGRFVAESIEKYFGLTGIKFATYSDEYGTTYRYDGKSYHFGGADGEATYYARVKKVSKNANGTLTMSGEIYNVEDETEIRGPFEAVAKPHKFKGKDTWAIISLQASDE